MHVITGGYGIAGATLRAPLTMATGVIAGAVVRVAVAAPRQYPVGAAYGEPGGDGDDDYGDNELHGAWLCAPGCVPGGTAVGAGQKQRLIKAETSQAVSVVYVAANSAQRQEPASLRMATIAARHGK